MASSAAVRKPATSAGTGRSARLYWPTADGEPNPIPRTVDSYLPFDHELVGKLGWLTRSDCARAVLELILSLTNKRSSYLEAKGRRPTGYTKVLTLREVEKELEERWDIRSIQIAVRQLADPECPVIFVQDRKDALRLKLIDNDEAGCRKESYCFGVNRDVWVEIIRRRKAEEKARREAAAALAEQEAEENLEENSEEAKPQGPRVLAITSTPVLHSPGRRVPKIALDDEQQNAIALVEALQPRSKQSTPVAISFRIKNNVLEYDVLDAPSEGRTEGERSAKSVSRQTYAGNGNGSHNGRTEGEQSAKSTSHPTYTGNGNGSHNGRMEGEWSAKYTSRLNGASDGVSLETYPEFSAKVKRIFPATPASAIERGVLLCRTAAKEAGLAADWASDLVLCEALDAPTIRNKSQRTFWALITAKAGVGKLVQCVANWAEEYRRTGTVKLDDGQDGDPVLKMLERTRGRW